MTGVLIILFVAVVLLLVLVASVVVGMPDLSVFELERRQKTGDKAAEEALRKHAAYGDITSLQRVFMALLLVLVVVFGVLALGWFVGILFSVVVALEYGMVARVPFVHAWAQRLYVRYESAIVDFVIKQAKIMAMLRTVIVLPSESRIASREELIHYVGQAGVVLSADEKQRIVSGLSFGDKTVDSVMTPKSVIDSIKKGEMLGALVLDDLHKTGHSRVPVIDGDIDHIVGVLHIRDLLVIDSVKKHTPKVETVMEPHVYYIREDQTLDHALAAFLKTHHHLFIVVNEYRETVGLLTLEDVIETLLGKKIVDEFDAHDDLRKVAERNPRKNNEPVRRNDV